MAEIDIPDRFIKGFQNLAALPDDIFKSLCDEISKAPVGYSVKKLELHLNERINFEGLSDVIRTIISLAHLYYGWDEDKQELAEELALSYDEKTESDSFEILKRRLTDVFNSYGNLSTTFKALNLLAEVDKIYRKARIITDVRLVFGDSIEDTNRSGVIFHQLKLVYTQDADSFDFFVSMDKSDLHELRKQIDRALDKEEAIKKDYSNLISFTNFLD